MRRSAMLAAALAVLCAGCYHVTVVTGAPAGSTAIDVPWQHSFIIGLVPPSEINSKQTCPQGVAKVETEKSFLNGLVGAIYNIYTPIHVTVTCATGPVGR